MSPALPLYTRDNGSLSKQNIIIIIAVCSSAAGLILLILFWRAVRSRRQSQSTPLPPPQPLAHHREQEIALFEETRAVTWYEPQLSPAGHLLPNSPGESKASLLRKVTFSSSPSMPPSTETVEEIVLPEDDVPRYLPLPTASFHLDRPGSTSSLGSSDASCGTLPLSPESAAPLFRKPTSSSASASPIRRPRPLSMASTSTHHTAMSRRGVPHAPYNQIQIILPTPLASANNSVETLARRRSRYGSEVGNRRSVADPWINIVSESIGAEQSAAPARRRHASMGLPTASLRSVLDEEQISVPTAPAPGAGARPKTRRLEKRRG